MKRRRSHRDYPGKLPCLMRGLCRWCLLPIRKPDGTINMTRSFCGPVCVTHFQLRVDPQKMRQHVFYRDNGVCAKCGRKHTSVRSKEWEADHVIPLMVSFGDPRYWEPENVVVLCTDPCHKIKTGEDRRRYRKKYREKWRLEFSDEE